MCGALSPKYRIITILIMCTLFGVSSLYLTVSSIYNIGWRDARRQYAETTSGGMQIEHIKQLDIPMGKHSRTIVCDTIYKPFNSVIDERKQSSDNGE
jgi:hypothetical protein